jgi:hypothetical protein
MLMAVPVSVSGSTIVVGTPEKLFPMRGVAWDFLFDTRDGKQLVVIVDNERDPSPLTTVVNWTPPRCKAVAYTSPRRQPMIQAALSILLLLATVAPPAPPGPAERVAGFAVRTTQDSLAKPAGVTATPAIVPSGERFTIAWKAVTNASAYDVQMQTAPDLKYFGDASIPTSQPSLTWTAQRVGSDLTLYIRVRARTDAGVGEWSEPVTVVYKAPPGLTPPLAPAITASAARVASEATFYLDWQIDPSVTDSRLDITVGAWTQTMTALGKKGRYPFHFSVTEQTPATFRITVSNLGGTTSSPVVTVTIVPAAPTLPAPSLLAVSPTAVTGGNTFTITWRPVARAVTYDVQMQTAPDLKYFGGASIPSNQPSLTWTAQAVSKDLVQNIRVRARDQAGVSAWSDAVLVTYKPKPGVTLPVVPTIRASATRVTSDATFYVDWQIDASATTASMEIKVGSRTQTMTSLGKIGHYPFHFGVTQRTPVTFQITASNAAGTVCSAIVTVVIDPVRLRPR